VAVTALVVGVGVEVATGAQVQAALEPAIALGVEAEAGHVAGAEEKLSQRYQKTRSPEQPRVEAASGPAALPGAGEFVADTPVELVAVG
jgi:hypothetical protein